MKDRDVSVGALDTVDIGPQSGGDAPFTARMRLHQSWYRATVLQVPCGTGPQPSSQSHYGNMLDAAAGAAGLNFLTPEIFAIARARIAQGGGVEPFRCLHNMLSSQPMCFNLFGPLVADLDLATRCMRALLPDEVDRVTEVRIEYAPSPADEYLGDRTSFDAFVAYTRLDGAAGFLGIETKLTEPFSPGEYHKQSYQRLTERDGSLWRRDAWATMSRSEWNQLWRNHLLVEALCRHSRPQHGTRGRSILIRHPGDLGVAAVVEQYRSFLTAPDDTFSDWPLDRVVDAFAGVCIGEHEASWIQSFRLRYLDLAASEPALLDRCRPVHLLPPVDPAPVVSAAPSGEFGDGVWEVGVDIEPGVYASTSVDHCYWERMSGFTGDDILANGTADAGTHVIVEILPTDAGFTSQGCGTWRKRR